MDGHNVCVESLIGLLGYKWEELERSQNCMAQMLFLYVSFLGGWLSSWELYFWLSTFLDFMLQKSFSIFFLFLLTLYIFDVYGHVELSVAPVSDGIFLSMNVAIIESLLVDFDKLLLALFPISIRTF